MKHYEGKGARIPVPPVWRSADDTRRFYFDEDGQLSGQFLELSMWVVRAACAFNAAAPIIAQGVRVHRLEDFARVSRSALARVRHVGPKSIREIATLLAERGLELLP